MNQDPELAREAFRVGASGYLLKTSAASELFQAVREALRGRSYVTPLLGEDAGESVRRRFPPGGASRDLNPRQREVVQLLAEGRSMKEAAGILKISARTVAFHKYRVMEKLRLKTTAELVQYAVKHRIVFP